jgi:hypothetical protein
VIVTDGSAASERGDRSLIPGVLICAAGPHMRAVMHDLAAPTFRRYAARWGHEVEITDLGVDGVGAGVAAQAAKWQKIALLRSALIRFPLAVWLDADVLLLRDDDDVVSHLRHDNFQALAIEQVPAEHRINPNTGVWMLRSCPESFAFLDAIEALGPQPGPWADQGAVLAALGWDRGDANYHWAGPGRGNDYLVGTSWLPVGWNQPYLTGRIDTELYNGSSATYVDRAVVPKPHALHFMGMTPTARYEHMSAFRAAPFAMSGSV